MTPGTLQHPPAPTAQPKLVPEMPSIPGLKAPHKPGGFQPKPLLIVILAALLCGSGFAFWLSQRRQADLASAPAGVPSAVTSSTSNAPSTTRSDQEPGAIATLYELAAPWSSKAFHFIDPQTHESVPAMIIHLPGPPAEPSFWAFSLATPFSRCDLQYVTDLSAIARRFAYSAVHPMVVSECDGVLYDPLKMATLPDGSWVRGDIVRGGGIRPPVAIQVEVHGRNIIAKRIE